MNIQEFVSKLEEYHCRQDVLKALEEMSKRSCDLTSLNKYDKMLIDMEKESVLEVEISKLNEEITRLKSDLSRQVDSYKAMEKLNQSLLGKNKHVQNELDKLMKKYNMHKMKYKAIKDSTNKYEIDNINNVSKICDLEERICRMQNLILERDATIRNLRNNVQSTQNLRSNLSEEARRRIANGHPTYEDLLELDNDNVKTEKMFIVLISKECKVDVDCTICMDKIEIGKNSVNCTNGHMFHVECLVRWLHEKNTCPVCVKTFYDN